MQHIGIDFGGTKIEVAVLDAAGAFQFRHRVANPGNYDAAIAAVRDLVAKAEEECGPGTVGIGMPGSVSPATGVMRNANSTYLNGRSFREDVSAALNRAVRVTNDANCLALSEAADGAAAGAKSAFAVIIGTGCGGGLVQDGKIIEGAGGIAGEWGHIPLPWTDETEVPGPECWCGQRGCLETWISGSGFARDYLSATGKAAKGEEIIADMRKGVPDADAAFTRYVSRLGRGLAMVCNLFDPEVIVLGGGMSNVPELYEVVPDVIRSFLFSDVWCGRIAKAKWGDSSGVRGAARLWP